MAQVIKCDIDGCMEAANVLVTDVSTGHVDAFCGTHYLNFIMETATAIAERQIAEQANSEAADGDAGGTRPDAPRSRRRRRPEAAAAEPEEGSSEPAPENVDGGVPGAGTV